MGALHASWYVAAVTTLFTLTACVFLNPTSALKYSSPLELECQSCLPGTFSPEGFKNCSSDTLQCPGGWCINATLCKKCVPGTANSAFNATGCPTCGPGFVAQQSGAERCDPCPARETNSSDHTYCVPCPAGYFNPDKGRVCGPCPAGTYSERRSLNCTDCPPGTYNDAPHQDQCRTCPQGFFLPWPNRAAFPLSS
jgi:hypothetical protein